VQVQGHHLFDCPEIHSNKAIFHTKSKSSPVRKPNPSYRSLILSQMSTPNAKKLEGNAGEASKHKSNTSRQRAAPSARRQEIAFVNLTDSSGPTQDAEKRKLVRAHVMRGYQLQKQVREDEDLEKFLQDKQRDRKAPSITMMQLPEAKVPARDVIENAEPEFPETFGQVNWTSTLDFRLNPAELETDRIFGQQLEREWIPVTKSDSEDNQSMAIGMIYDTDNPKYAFDQSGGAIYDLSSLLQGGSSQQTDLVPEEIECPLISQSLTLRLSFNALNSGMLDPFNAMPGLKNARAQALMYHC
jgi:hypothetical protein